MSVVAQVKKIVAELKAGTGAGARLRRLELPPEIVLELRREMKLSAADAVAVVDGVEIHAMAPRAAETQNARLYAYYRWGIEMTSLDVETLFKAVPDDELASLATVIIDQHMDDHGYPDPVDEMDEAEVVELRKVIEELGYVDVEI